MADTTDATTACNWIAIDVARYWNAVLIETAPGQRHRFKMANTVEDLDRLIEFIGGLGGRCRAGLEPTGDYHRAIAYRLRRLASRLLASPRWRSRATARRCSTLGIRTTPKTRRSFLRCSSKDVCRLRRSDDRRPPRPAGTIQDLLPSFAGAHEGAARNHQSPSRFTSPRCTSSGPRPVPNGGFGS